MLKAFILIVAILFVVPVLRTTRYVSRLQHILSKDFNMFQLYIIGKPDWVLVENKPDKVGRHVFRLAFTYCGTLRLYYLVYNGDEYYNKALRLLLKDYEACK